jgi:lambda family phage portal protein
MAAGFESVSIDVSMGQSAEAGTMPVVGSVSPKALARAAKTVRARYDAAQTTRENANHWAWSDGLSASAAASPTVRRTLRNRSRYELDNNSYYKGIVQTIANDTIGTGPHISIPWEGNPADANIVEREFNNWVEETRLVSKLRTMAQTKVVDGESFGLFIDNPRLPTPVTLDIRLVEADQIATPSLVIATPLQVDGITFDEQANPITYHMLLNHPGDQLAQWSMRTIDIDADNVIHWFRADRPGQVRGLPEAMAAVPLFANLRRFTLAVIAAAETAANHSGVIQSTLAPNDEDDDVELAPEPGDTFQIDRDSFVTIPQGWTMQQLDAKQPTTTYSQFKGEILQEIARCISMPKNIATCDSSGYNYSSGRLDHQLYFKSIDISRHDCEAVAIRRIFRKWLAQAVLIENYLPPKIRRASLTIRPVWHWDEPTSIDPVKDAAANTAALASGQTTYREIWGRKGKDYRDGFKQIGQEIREAAEEGITLAYGQAALIPTEPAPIEQPTDGQPADVTDGGFSDE